MNILIVDDEKDFCVALSAILKQNNYNADYVLDGEAGLDYALSGIYDLFILDVMMPKKNGFELLKELRAQKIDTPVLMLTAKSDTDDKIDGLNFGADDYITKPFNTQELLARVRALLRRSSTYTGNVLNYAGVSLDRDAFELFCGERRIALGKKEFQILELLMSNAGKIVEKERIIEKIWGYDSEAEYNTVEVYISFIRRKLAGISAPAEIKVIRGVGYSIGEKSDKQG